MHTRSYPSRLGLPTPAAAPPTLHLLAGRWVAACPSCGYQLASARSQARCERRASRRCCPVCYGMPPTSGLRGLRRAVQAGGHLERLISDAAARSRREEEGEWPEPALTVPCRACRNGEHNRCAAPLPDGCCCDYYHAGRLLHPATAS